VILSVLSYIILNFIYFI